MNYKPSPPSDTISQVLKDRIVSGKYPPRTIISEKEICEEFSVSRTPFREAIKKLEGLRLVEVVPRFGTYVSEVNFHEVKYAFEVRLALDPWACRLAAERRTPEQLSQLETIIGQGDDLVKDQDSVSLRSELDIHCHNIIYAASHNPVLRDELDRLRTVCARVWTSSFRQIISVQVIISQWENMYLAVRDSNGEAAAALMTEHIQYTTNCLKEGFF
jgi:GntR family transcriptional regulator, rspAB operon transcriptional repressor